MRSSPMLLVVCLASGLHAINREPVVEAALRCEHAPCLFEMVTARGAQRVLQREPLFGDEEQLISEAEEECAALLPAQTADSCLGRSFNITEECKCYWSCFWKKFKFEREDGSIDKDLLMEFIASYAQSPGDVMSSPVERSVEACVEESTAGCGRVKQILECVGDSYGAGDSTSEDDYGVS